MAAKNNWSGIIINGAVRDTVALGQIYFGVKALGSNPRKSDKKGIGTRDTAIKIGNLRIKPGDWVYCDEDGILVAGRELPVE
jgi:regulator of ribonuclease activity A